MNTLINLLEAMSFWSWMAVIVIGCLVVEGIVKVERMQIKHAERMVKFSRESIQATKPRPIRKMKSKTHPDRAFWL